MPARHAICLCTDNRMLIPALFVADSVRRHSAARLKDIDIIVVAEPAEADETHRAWMEQRGILLCDDLDTSQLRDVPIIQERLSAATLMKLRLAEHFAGRYEKILYLDADITIHSDIAAIFALDTGEFPLAAVRAAVYWPSNREAERTAYEDHCSKLGMTPPFRYVNTGVLLIDIDKWNRERLGFRALEYIRRNPELCRLPDEDALNALLDGRIAELSPIWNMPPTRWRRAFPEIARPVIVHHMGEDKPWRRYGCRKRLFPDRTAYRAYESFLEDTPWKGWLDQQWSGRDLRLNLIWEIRRITRWLRGRPEEPPRAARAAYLDAVKQYYASHNFADVEQGIVLREDGQLSLNGKDATAKDCEAAPGLSAAVEQS